VTWRDPPPIDRLGVDVVALLALLPAALAGNPSSLPRRTHV
jgi:hypothetical protein